MHAFRHRTFKGTPDHLGMAGAPGSCWSLHCTATIRAVVTVHFSGQRVGPACCIAAQGAPAQHTKQWCSITNVHVRCSASLRGPPILRSISDHRSLQKYQHGLPCTPIMTGSLALLQCPSDASLHDPTNPAPADLVACSTQGCPQCTGMLTARHQQCRCLCKPNAQPHHLRDHGTQCQHSHTHITCSSYLTRHSTPRNIQAGDDKSVCVKATAVPAVLMLVQVPGTAPTFQHGTFCQHCRTYYLATAS
jgi:hypothetical protein